MSAEGGIGGVPGEIPPELMFLLLIQFARDVGGELVVERQFLERDGVAARVLGAALDADGALDDAAELLEFLGRAGDRLAGGALCLQRGRRW